MSQKTRVEDLERKTGAKEQPFAVVWPDGRVTVKGETMTEDEFKARWPGADLIRVVYGS